MNNFKNILLCLLYLLATSLLIIHPVIAEETDATDEGVNIEATTITEEPYVTADEEITN